MDNPSYFAVANGGGGDLAADRDEPDAPAGAGPAAASAGPAPARCAWLDGSRSLTRRPREPPRRRDFRALLRSLSAREGGFCDERGFLQGRPRPGDVAPDEVDSVPLRIKGGKISSTVATPKGVKEREEVFYTIPLQNRRRHSVGGYLTAGSPPSPGGPAAVRITTVPSDVPRMPAPKITPSSPADTIKRRKQKVFNFKEMEDISILWSKESPESELWSDYLVTCFDKIMSQRARHHYRVTSTSLEEIIGKSTAEQLQKIAKSQLQIIVLCPRFAAKMAALRLEIPDNFFKTDKVLAMLLGVEKQHVVANNLKEYTNIDQWQMMEVKEKDSTFVDNFLTSAVGILRTKDCKDTSTDKTSFSIVPKKVKLGQSRVIALLNEPVREEDSIKITVDKREAIQITTFKRRNPYTLQFDIPDSCLEVSMLIWIRISKNGQALGRRQIKCESRLRELDQILRANDHPIEFMCQTLGFKMTSREQLDSWMLSAFQRNIPPHFNLLAAPHFNPTDAHTSEEYPTLLHFAARFGLEKLSWQLLECPGGEAACRLRNARQMTPADLAHAAGFAQLAVVLNGHVQMNEFTNMYYYLKNISENSKETVEEERVEINTANELKIVEAGDEEEPKRDSTDEEQPEQTSTDPFSEECLQNLEISDKIKNISNLPNYINEQVYQNDIIFPPPDDIDRVRRAIQHDYLFQPSNIKVETEPPRPRPNNLYVNGGVGTLSPQSDVFLYSPTEEAKSFNVDTPTSDIAQMILKEPCKSTAGSIKSGRENSPLSGQEELVEIINDFKNNVFSISEVEKLVMDWRNRNETQQSLKEKQEQLDKMRKEYERLQQKIKENLKRPTPFERVKKLFSKGKQKNADTNNGSIEKRNASGRPNSSLSESSTSSGRLSTASAGSIGDHSFQSEFDDKRISSNNLSISSSATIVDIDTKIEDYLIPPPPRPLNGSGYASPVTMTTFRQHKMATIEERDLPTPEQGTHMRMAFDPICRSNSLPDGTNGRHMYMNVTPSKT